MSGLGQTAREYLREAGCERAYADGAVVVRRGEPGGAFYVVVSGAVDVLLVADDGRRLPLARLGEGSSFGEMSLLTGEAVSADVVARGGATLLVYPGEQFQTALAECAELRNHILVRLCENLHRTSTKAWDLFQRAEALRTLVHATEPAGAVVAESTRLRRVSERIAELAPRPSPVLISGEPGTGKLFAARQIHEHAGDADAPLIIVDCPLFEPGDAGRLLFGSAEDRQFGAAAGGAGTLSLIGAVDLADGGTIVLRHVEALDAPAQATMSRYLAALRDAGDAVSPRVRVLATTCIDPASLADADGFDAGLAEGLAVETLSMPPMSDRRKDILPLAGLFLTEHDRRADGRHRFNRSAEHALLSAAYRYRNAAELREAVDFAALFAEGDEIGSEHVFTGPKDEGTTAEYDLAHSGPVRWLLDRGGLRLCRGAILAFFVAMTAACLLVPGTIVGRIANAMAWGLWWPAMLVAFLVLGRAWCAVCPISLAGRMVRRLGSLAWAPPQWIKRHTGWLIVVLFVAIVWSEHVFDMTHRPVGTAVLFLALAAAAVVCCAVFQREVWCRYLCPLGSLGAGYSVAGMLHVRANPSVCATQCRTHECFKGTETTSGCPVFHHPLYARDGHLCKLCLDCLGTCPHGSARLVLRPPLQGVWRAGGAGETLVPFALVVTLLAVVMLASQGSGPLASTGRYTAGVLAAVAVGFALVPALKRLLDGDRAAAVTPVAFAMLVLAAGPLMAFHMGNIPGLAMVRLHAAAAGAGLGQSPFGQRSLLAILQGLAVLVAAVLAAVAFWRTRVHLAGLGERPGRWRWRLLLGFCDLYVLAALALVLL